MAAFAALPTTATPPKLEPVSTSANWPPNATAIDWPPFATGSSATPARVPSPSVGASFTEETAINAVSVAVLYADEPPFSHVDRRAGRAGGLIHAR